MENKYTYDMDIIQKLYDDYQVNYEEEKKTDHNVGHRETEGLDDSDGEENVFMIQNMKEQIKKKSVDKETRSMKKKIKKESDVLKKRIIDQIENFNK